MLKITIDRERGVRGSLMTPVWIRKGAAAVLELEGITAHAELSVLLTDDEGIRTINKAFRDIDKPTDVLSFPANELSKPLKAALDEGFAPERDLKSGRMFLGDIVISMERAKKQAGEFGHSLKREVAFLTVHAMLHLTGYDHEEKECEEIMREKQRLVMEKIRIKR